MGSPVRTPTALSTPRRSADLLASPERLASISRRLIRGIDVSRGGRVMAWPTCGVVRVSDEGLGGVAGRWRTAGVGGSGGAGARPGGGGGGGERLRGVPHPSAP